MSARPNEEWLLNYKEWLKTNWKRDVKIKDKTVVVGKSDYGSRNEEFILGAYTYGLELKRMDSFEMVFGLPEKGKKGISARDAISLMYSGKDFGADEECEEESECDDHVEDGGDCGSGCINFTMPKGRLERIIRKLATEAIKEIAPESFTGRTNPETLINPIIENIKKKFIVARIDFAYRGMKPSDPEKPKEREPLTSLPPNTRYVAGHWTYLFVVPYITQSGLKSNWMLYLHITTYYHETRTTGNNEINAYVETISERSDLRLERSTGI